MCVCVCACACATACGHDTERYPSEETYQAPFNNFEGVFEKRKDVSVASSDIGVNGFRSASKQNLGTNSRLKGSLC